MITWTVTAPQQHRGGASGDRVGAWTAAAAAAVELSTLVAEDERIALEVGKEPPARLRPARTGDGALDLEATRTACQALVQGIVDEAGPVSFGR